MKLRIPKISSLIYYIKLYSNKFVLDIKKLFVRNKILKWIYFINKHHGTVLIGANVDKMNGVDLHIHAIEKYSSLKTALIPSDEVLSLTNSHDFVTNYLDKVVVNRDTILHSHVYPYFISWCEEQKKKIPHLKWIHTYHLNYYQEHALGELLDWQKEFNRVFVEVASKADIKLSVSRWQQNFYKEKFNIDTIYIPNGVNVEQCDQANPKYFKNTYGIDNFILNVSRHDPVKNPKEFVELAIAMPTYEFVIIGSELTETLFIEHYNITPPDNIKILGKMTQPEVQNAIAACACLVSTSKREGLPTLVLEGMTQSKAVVVSNEPGSMEAINHGDYGYYYELGNIEDLKKQTLLAFDNTSIGAKARQRILEEYDWRVVIKKLDTIYNG